jgi:YidC/Oxa1 family membrane protein insertase
MQDNKNFFLAIALSMAVLIGWNVFFGMPTLDQQRKEATAPAQTAQPGAPGAPASPAVVPPVDPARAAPTRDAAIAATQRIVIDTPRVRGSISLRGGDIDDIALKDYRETVDPKSPNIIVFSPANGPDAYFARIGWLPSSGIAVPTADTIWTASATSLSEQAPVTLTWDNGQGLLFKRLVAIDANFMVTVTDSVEATRQGIEASVTPYSFIRRVGTPVVAGFYILHEGLLGVIGENGLQEFSYSSMEKEPLRAANERAREFKDAVGGFIGITDKYWASALVPDQTKPFNAAFSMTKAPTQGAIPSYQTIITHAPAKVDAATPASSVTRIFVGAKEVRLIDRYQQDYNIKLFDRLIDWGWFYWITKPLFKLLDIIYHLVGNFGVAILIVTVLVKLVFFPLANKSYVSMAKMKAVQPEMVRIKEQYPDDRVKQQQELMELYKKEKINPLAGCLPVIIQIPVFFALYKVLFVTIEMRHAPFFGWIRDLAAPDPTSIFNLFGLLPWSVPAILLIGVWPIIMGITMFVQMKMNPEPTDPIQKTMFTWMPVFFTYLLASFPAGLVIYWSWNNLLSVMQQYFIMRRQGVKVELWDNLRGLFGKKADKPA